MSDDKKISKIDTIFTKYSIGFCIFFIVYATVIYGYNISLTTLLNTHFKENFLFIYWLFILILIIPVLGYLFVVYILHYQGKISGYIISIILPILITGVGAVIVISPERIEKIINQNTPKILEVTSEVMKEIDQEQLENKRVFVDSDLSTNTISLYSESKTYSTSTQLKFEIFINNSSSKNYGILDQTSYKKQVYIVFPEGQELIIDNVDLREEKYEKPVDQIIESGQISKGILFNLDKVFGKVDNIHFFLRYNGDNFEPSDYRIDLIDIPNIAIMNSSGLTGVANKYYTKLIDTPFGIFPSIQKINNFETEDDGTLNPIYKDKLESNEILYFDDRFEGLVNTINKGVFEQEFSTRNISLSDCENMVLDGSSEPYQYDGIASSPNRNQLCRSENILLNVLD